MSDVAPAEHGDRRAFLDRIRSREGRPPGGGPHPPPPAPDVVPELRYRTLDGIAPDDVDALLPVFVSALRAAEATVDVVDGAPSDDLLRAFVDAYGIGSAVTSEEPLAIGLGSRLADLGVDVARYSRDVAEAADVAVTSATHAVAATGSVVVDAESAGSRAVSLLPRVHLCVVPLDRLVASHADVLRRQQRPMPSARVLVTGPSRTGDIEQRLTLGAHGPVALHVIVLR
jgi:L-lactate utilization protein LutC